MSAALRRRPHHVFRDDMFPSHPDMGVSPPWLRGATAAPAQAGPVGFPCDLQAHRKHSAVPGPRPGEYA
ncbi:hypothetical protein SBRY_50429 [Actinacidiphila bryophytorum]|uniref:Uncharacterized protein n=1 Tax=Actinacidiphila bryophytorum TaxID=1436133 RepID=A0A9W4H4B7_9ACTN|nr:hypothetical protein SBRY_50429 [Actinacidiphila bryophytorum]